MPKIPYRVKENTVEDEDEIVSFEAFCSDPLSQKARNDALSLNDNINYRICFEGGNGDSSGDKDSINDSAGQEKETSLTNLRVGNSKGNKGGTLNSFANLYPRNARSPFLKGARKDEGSDGSDDTGHKYQRFTDNRYHYSNLFTHIQGIGSGILVLSIICVLCVAVWWGVWAIIGDAWGEEHYRRIWERAHPNPNQQTHYYPSVVVHQQLESLDPIPPHDTKFHDHNNLNIKNKRNASESSRMKFKTDQNKKNTVPVDVNEEDDRLPADANQCANVKDDFRFDCYPEQGASEAACNKRGCCWVPHNQSKHVYRHHQMLRDGQTGIGFPYCFYPPKYMTYRFVNMTENKHGITAYFERQFSTDYPDNFKTVEFVVRYLSDDILQIKILDTEKRRFEPPYPELPIVPGPINHLKYSVVIDPAKTGFKVIRAEDNVVLLDTQDIGGFILSDKFLQISSLLPSHNIYGLGERRGRFQLSTNWQRHTLFNYDTLPNENTNLYGSHPFYLVMEESGKSHGVLLLNSNAMDVVLQPAPAITFRTIGGILNLYIMVGSAPGQVVQQYTAVVGRPFMPPYWALGFHLCKFGYGSVNETRAVWERTRKAGIPFDTQWNDLDYMNNSNDFTYDHVKFAGLPQFVKQIHDSGMHYIPLIDPGVSASEEPGSYPPFDIGMDMDVFVKNSNNTPFVGKVWNKATTVWPDFTHPNATPYWVEMLASYHRLVPFDGAWIDMNEPSNFLSGPINGSCQSENFPYMPAISGNAGLRSKTMCMDAKHYAGRHSDLHNLHALTEAIATNFALSEVRGKRPFIISRSSFVGLGRHAGHWSGDIASQWHDMKMTIPEMLSFSLFGIPMMGADICGFRGNTTVELCKRWMQLGAFYPFSRNHNSDQSTPQDPVYLGAEVENASRIALRVRYTLLPYLYTLFYCAHTRGDTVVRPMFFEFPKDNVTFSIDQQFMWGPSILVVPVLTPGASSVRAYLPAALWYKFNDSSPANFTGWGKLDEGHTVLVRGGGVVPMQTPTLRPDVPITTTVSRSRPLQVLAALDEDDAATGLLYWDDGDSLNTEDEKKYTLVKFIVRNNSMKCVVQWWGLGVPEVDTIILLGVGPVRTVTLRDKPLPFSYNPVRRSLIVRKLSITLSQPFVLRWK